VTTSADEKVRQMVVYVCPECGNVPGGVAQLAEDIERPPQGIPYCICAVGSLCVPFQLAPRADTP
jgi:hypothetical protein